MFDAISIPFGARMLFDTVKLEPGVSMDDVEFALGAMCTDARELDCELLWQGTPDSD